MQRELSSHTRPHEDAEKCARTELLGVRHPWLPPRPLLRGGVSGSASTPKFPGTSLRGLLFCKQNRAARAHPGWPPTEHNQCSGPTRTVNVAPRARCAVPGKQAHGAHACSSRSAFLQIELIFAGGSGHAGLRDRGEADDCRRKCTSHSKKQPGSDGRGEADAKGVFGAGARCHHPVHRRRGLHAVRMGAVGRHRQVQVRPGY